ncbi:hypothetical protein A2870_01505 [Candidatus Curtissbacteria bacterium RIFCSPHIGHO2_01_FULL_41_11]|uniref:NIF system FeS cluster assembly NifU N-terminal domain-containing protein n=1 Tax=Candidatus Curtissbacteria bacterium RIFCSPHIGHO2_01_FULL_41_11 TaxID=1797711 RepID=A0A1F5G6A7_9BACT|nr:MAG: hypothetical protein A2870_01505 [Candidatus Curtissbacteria bacterium RIFCSPHIGHO2_01_FULL_41_11]
MMDLYREEILEHWRNPQNFGEMKKPDVVVEQVNPLCGDRVIFFFKIKKGKIEDVKFTGSGCAISVASSSILSEAIKGKSVKAIERITGQDVLVLIGGDIAPARLKCVFLPLEAVRKLTGR